MSRHIPRPIEALEDRTLLSVAVLVRGVLRVAGDGPAGNTITVANSPDAASIDVTINSVNARGVAKAPFTRSFPRASGISSIVVTGGRLNDAISVGQPNALLGVAAFDMPARVFSGAGNDLITLTNSADFVFPGAGNDTVSTAGGNDVVFAGAGDDNVSAGEGDDVVRGMVGNDTLNGGIGADRLAGGAGNDSVGGGQGTDVVRGDVGDDILEGGPENDTVFGGAGNDAMSGGGGNDALWGGLGDDSLEGGQGTDLLGGVLGRNNLLGGQDADTFRVRDLALNGTNDFNATQGDVVEIVANRNDGPKPPAI